MLRSPPRCRFPRFEVEPGGYNPEWREPDDSAGGCGTGVGGSGGRTARVRCADRVVARRLPRRAGHGARRHGSARTTVATPAAPGAAPLPHQLLRIVLSTMAACAAPPS